MAGRNSGSPCGGAGARSASERGAERSEAKGACPAAPRTGEGPGSPKHPHLHPHILFRHFGPVEVGQEACRGAGGGGGLQAVEVGQLADDLGGGVAAAEVFEALVAVPLGEAAAVGVQQ